MVSAGLALLNCPVKPVKWGPSLPVPLLGANGQEEAGELSVLFLPLPDAGAHSQALSAGGSWVQGGPGSLASWRGFGGGWEGGHPLWPQSPSGTSEEKERSPEVPEPLRAQRAHRFPGLWTGTAGPWSPLADPRKEVFLLQHGGLSGVLREWPRGSPCLEPGSVSQMSTYRLQR